MPITSQKLTRRQIEIIRLLCNGFTTPETAAVLNLAVNTINTQKKVIYAVLNVRNEKELIRAALFLNLIKLDELAFHGGDYGGIRKP